VIILTKYAYFKMKLKIKENVFEESDTLQFGRNLPAFRMIVLPPSSKSKRNVRKQAANEVGFYSGSYLVVAYSAYSSTLKMEEVRSSERSIYFYQTTRHCITPS
jgi:hypothetical protein